MKSKFETTININDLKKLVDDAVAKEIKKLNNKEKKAKRNHNK